MPVLNRGKGKRVASSSDESDSEDNDTIKFENVAPEYLNQPIGSAMGVARIDSIISAYKDLAAALKTQLDALQNAACDIARVERSGPNPPGSRPLKNLDNDPEAIKRVDRHYRSTLDQLYAHETRIKVLSAIRNNLDADPSNTINDPVAMFEAEVARRLDAYDKKTSRERYGNHKDYVEYRTALFEELYGDIKMGSIKNQIPKEGHEIREVDEDAAADEDGDEDDDDDEDLEVETAANFNCQITLGTLKEPMSSRLCSHSFSREALAGLFKQSGTVRARSADSIPENSQIPCPAAGCAVTLTWGDMYENEQLARRIAAHLRRKEEAKRTQAKAGGSSRTAQQTGPTQRGAGGQSYNVIADSEDEDSDDES